MEEHCDMREFVGAVVGDRYRLERFLDEGAFGAVFKAAQIAYGVELREVAIKVAKRPMTDSAARRTFGDALLMARVADTAPDAALRERFVTIHDASRFPEGAPLAGHPYVVMELVRGGSLKDCLRAGRFPLKRTMEYFDQILKAVAFMHSGEAGGAKRGPITHRDLKPANILVSRPERAPDILKVSDFGLAIEVDTLLGWVESGGDLAYLAPESFSHNICSPQSDVYMLGLVFHEMLTKENPFAEVGAHLRGTDKEKQDELRRLHLTARQLEQYPLLHSDEELPQRPGLMKVIRTTLQADMSARTYKNACELMAAWEQAKAGDRGPDRPAPPEQAWETVRRLTSEAEQSFAVHDQARGEAILHKAIEINRDNQQVSGSMVVGRTYLLMVRRLLDGGRTEEAGKLAMEGYGRRKCCSTCHAMAWYFAAQKSPLAARFEQEAATCSDRE